LRKVVYMPRSFIIAKFAGGLIRGGVGLFVLGSSSLLIGGLWGTWHLIEQGRWRGWALFGSANCIWIGFYLLVHDFLLPWGLSLWDTIQESRRRKLRAAQHILCLTHWLGSSHRLAGVTR
jgi:hypothetical protein